MLSDALSYPQSGNGWQSVIIGGLLMAFGWLLVPAFIVFGYYVRVLRGAALAEENAPRFEDWGDLLADGFKSFLVYLGYVFLPMLLVFVLLFSGLAIGGENGGLVFFLVVGLLGAVFLFGMGSLFPVALTAFALTDRLGAAFEIRSIVESAFTGDYAVSVLLSVVLRIGVGMAVGIVMYIIQLIFSFVFIFGMIGVSGTNSEPAIGMGMILAFIVAFFIYLVVVVIVFIASFYIDVASYHILARGCGPSLRDALPVDRPTPTETVPDTPDRPEEP